MYIFGSYTAYVRTDPVITGLTTGIFTLTGYPSLL